MNSRLKKLACCAASAFLFIPAATTWAAPVKRAAHLFVQERANADVSHGSERTASDARRQVRRATLPYPVRMREVGGRGLLVSVWINRAGPYTFAVDTGAGATILSSRVAGEARVVVSGKRPMMIGGISGRGAVRGQEVSVSRLAVGDPHNVLPSRAPAVVIETLAPGLDGVLDPVEAYWPLGFEIDILGGSMTAFDPRSTPLRRTTDLTTDAAIVPWLVDGATRRPFVALEGGRRALIDTGSGLGLAVTADAAISLGIMRASVRPRAERITDLAGGTIAAYRIAPTTVRIGPLVLNGIPTDLLPNASASSPILLGRDALRPFRLTFDPINRLVRFVAV